MSDSTLDPDERSLLEAIFANPDDDGLRLVYANWLEERGDPRTEFVRAELLVWRAAGVRALTDAERVRLFELHLQFDADWVDLLNRQVMPDSLTEALLTVEGLVDQHAVDYVVSLEVFRLACVHCALPREAALAAMAGLSINGGLRPVTVDQMTDTVGRCLNTWRPPTSSGERAEYASAVNHILDGLRSRGAAATQSFEFTPRGRGWSPIMWGFAFVLELPAWYVVLTGQASD